jgi:biopolymer transport protein TolR
MGILGQNSGSLNLRRSGKKKVREGVLNLTSMIDMFSVLIVFLLKSFSTEGMILTVAPDLKLPESTSKTAPRSGSVIAVTGDWILLDGKRITPIDEIVNSNELLIPRLANELKQLRDISDKAGEISSNWGFKGSIAIEGDKEIPYLVLKKVMYTCGQIGYNDMMLAVYKIG